VTSGVYSPMFDCGIAFALIDADVKMNTACTVEIRGKHEPGTLVNKRFFKKDKP
jgi:aminomethyltransferase